MKIFKHIVISVLFAVSVCSCNNHNRPWTVTQANSYYEKTGWVSGCNFIPSTAINQLEMWQKETFDLETIDRELGWAENMGFNTMRVFLHHLVWENDREGFLSRMNDFLSCSDRHGIKTLFVFLDDCWEEHAHIGNQREPIPGRHNSGWLKDPGALYYGEAGSGMDYQPDTLAVEALLKNYVQDVLKTFGEDERIYGWDLYNEPGGGQDPDRYYEKSFRLLKKVFSWAREVNPSQPLTAGIWHSRLKEMNDWQIANSDIISYHTYECLEKHQHVVDTLKKYGRPMICTEYMARTENSTFQNIMPMLRKENVGAINWGLVAGKTNTIFSWETINNPMDADEPDLWFHDILHKDGTPYIKEEVEVIKEVNNYTRSGLNPQQFISENGMTSLYTIRNKKGMEVCLTNYGGRIVSVMVPDRTGKMLDVVLGFDNIMDYLEIPNNFGATIGRYGNRIASGIIELDGVKYQLPQNDFGHCLHGGPDGWDHRMMDVSDLTENSLVFSIVSPDGDANFPGTVKAWVKVTITDDNAIKLVYKAITDKKTIVNLTNHSYFNLSGKPQDGVLGHQMYINADSFTPIDATFMTSGEIAPVEGTPMDFRTPKLVGRDIEADYEQLRNGRGYDHNWVLKTKRNLKEVAASLYSPESGIKLEVFTDEPGLQVYTGNFLDGTITGKNGQRYIHRASVCMETQHYPDSPNKPDWPSVILEPGDEYTSTCIYKFSIEK